MEKNQCLEIFGSIERALAEQSAFGDSAYILRQLQRCMELRLKKISSRLPIAGELLDILAQSDADSLHHVVGDTVVRCAILHAYHQLEAFPFTQGLPLTECEKIFTATVLRLQQGKFATTLDNGYLSRLGPEPYHGWIWNEEHPDDIFGRSFRILIKERYDALPCTPSNDEIEMLAKGGRLLQDLLPTLAPSAFRHAHVISVVPNAGRWKGAASSSMIHLGGTIFLGRYLRSPWWAAEHLLHESMHQKLYDFREGHLLLELDIAEKDISVRSPWNSQQPNNANLWDVHRVFAAFHVYVHLALLAKVAEQRALELEATYGPSYDMIKSEKAVERAHYLGEMLKEQCWDQLALAGKRMVDWLTSALEFLNPSPAPKGAYVHLYLDLYRTEAIKVAAALRGSPTTSSSLPRRLAPLAKEEMENTRRVLSAINALQGLERFNNAVAQFTDEDLGTKYPEVRRVIATSLMNVSPNRYRLTESGDHDGLVKEMIENASQRVFAALKGYPFSVADAKRRANDLRFSSSCQDNVGRLLAVLACTVPAGGRILEIGTGVGVGTAWMTEGLGKRTDVNLVSVEVDTRLSDAARTWSWPAYVQIVTGDALHVLTGLPAFGMPSTFDLVFADAAPIKYGHIEPVLKMLRPGGLLLVDDIEVGTHTSEVQRAEIDTLRSLLSNHTDLQTAEIECSPGMILATKPMVSSLPTLT